MSEFCTECGDLFADSPNTHEGGLCRNEDQQGGFRFGVLRSFELTTRFLEKSPAGSVGASALHQLLAEFAAEFPGHHLRTPTKYGGLTIGECVEARWLTPAKKERVIQGVVTQLTTARVRIKYEWTHDRGRSRSQGVSEVWRLYSQVSRLPAGAVPEPPPGGVATFVYEVRDSELRRAQSTV